MAVISGRDPRYGGMPFINSLFLMHTGGAGAPHADAWLTTVHIGDLGLCYLDSVELDELRYPLRVAARGIVPDSEGAGRQRGAPSGFCQYEPVGTQVEAWFASDGTLNAAQGVRGGLAGGTSAQARRTPDGLLVELPPCGGVILQPGDVLECRCCGGGGYGDPLTRDPAQVLADISEGWISPARGRIVYGVALHDDGTLNTMATAALRAKAQP